MTQKYSRRTFLSLMGATTGAMALAACAAPGGPGSDSESSADAPSSDAAVELNFWTHTYDPLVAYVGKKIEEYKEIDPNVTIVHTATETAQYDERLFTSLAAGTGPDGFNTGEQNYPLLLDRSWIAPVTPEAFEVSTNQEVQDIFFEASLNGLIDGGDLYAIPLEWNALHLFYHRGAFAEAGLDPDSPPQTWEEVTDAAIALTKTDDVGNITFPGFQQSYGPGTEWPLRRLHPLLIQAGLDILNETKDSCTLNTPEAIEIVEYYTNWTTEHKVSVEGFAVPGVSGNPFRSGYVGMDLSGSYNPGAIRRASPDWEYNTDDGWGIANFPQWGGDRQQQAAAGMWRWGAMVNKDSVDATAMWSYIRYFISNTQEYNLEVGFIPSMKGWLDDPANHEGAPWLAIMEKDLEVGVPMTSTVKYQQIAQQNLEMLERIFGGAQTVAESVAEATEKIDAILQEG